jgi:phage-related protein (TIGR01555 family)
MGAVHYLRDSLINFVSGLGTFKDPSRSSDYTLNLLNRIQQENAYRADWIARRVVDAPAEDMTSNWRDWQADGDKITAIEALEKKLRLQIKLKNAIIRARLYGGGALVMGVEDGNQADEPLDLDKVGKDALRFLVVMNRYELSAGPRIYDVNSDWYTRPEYYTVQTPISGVEEPLPKGADPTAMNSVMTRVHPSRVIELVGNELPDWRLAPLGGGWGDSVLQTMDDTLRQWGLTVGGIAAMVNDAKMDVVKIPDFSKNIATQEYANRLYTRFAAANQSKSSINSLLLDKEEEWDRIQTNFGGLPNLLTELMTIVAGAANLPVSRLFGKAGSKGLGKSSSGQDELRNYYDGVSAEQRTELTPRLDLLDQVIIRSALGGPDDNVHYAWTPLYNSEPKELADIAKVKADTTQVYVTMGIINEDVLRDAAVNQLIEDGTYPGLEDAIDEYGSEPEVVEARVWSPGYDPVTGKPLAAAAPKLGLGAPPPMKQVTQQTQDASLTQPHITFEEVE